MENVPLSPTLLDVARRAGVAQSTVSRALRRDPRISSDTTRRVLHAAKELDYRPNPFISALMSHLRTTKPLPFRGALAFLDFFPEREAWKEWQVHRKWYEGARRRARQLGYTLDRVWAMEAGMTSGRLTRLLHARGIVGAIIPPDDRHLIYVTPSIPIDVNHFAVVTIGAQYHEPDLNFCTNDQFASMRTACLRLIELGYTRIGLVAPRYIEAIVDYRFGGAFLAVQLLERGMTKVVPVLYSETRSEFEVWFAHHRPDCVLALSPDAEVYEWLCAMKIKVPETLGFAVMDWDASRPEFSGISQMSDNVGAAAVEMIVEQINHNAIGVPISAKGTLVEGVWVDGPTTKPQ